MGAIPGSKASPEAPSGLRPSGYDPEREQYWFTNGWTAKRERDGYRWHLRNGTGVLIDTDRYRHDLISRHDLEIEHHHDPFAIAMEARRAETERLGSRQRGPKASPETSRD